ncbi:MAG: recombinase RecX [Maribacter sp.]|nr:MAG: recombinase RecX [Maribacter sp.]
MSQNPNTYTLAEATKKLERYCAYQERCHRDVTMKLEGMRMIPEAIDQIVTHLIQENYLNEERFSRSFARGKFNIKKWGRNKIVNELKRRHISSYNIRSALAEIDDTLYLETLDTIAKKKLESLDGNNITKRKKKLADYLLYRGWESHLVYSKIQELVTV